MCFWDSRAIPKNIYFPGISREIDGPITWYVTHNHWHIMTIRFLLNLNHFLGNSTDDNIDFSDFLFPENGLTLHANCLPCIWSQSLFLGKTYFKMSSAEIYPACLALNYILRFSQYPSFFQWCSWLIGPINKWLSNIFLSHGVIGHEIVFFTEGMCYLGVTAHSYKKRNT